MANERRILVGQTVEVSYQIGPGDTSEHYATGASWTSSDPSVLKVNKATGSATTVTGIAPGKATLTAAGGGVQVSMTVNVVEVKSGFIGWKP